MAAPLIEDAIGKIRDALLRGQLRPGERLPPEAALATSYGMSRSTVREAVRALVTARVLDVRRGDGTYVTSLRPELLLGGIGFALELVSTESCVDLIEVRKALEPAATALAAERANPQELGVIGECLRRMRGARHHEERLVRFDAEFHDAVARASGNSSMAALLRGVSSKTLRARAWRGVLERDATARAIAEHERIYAALLAHDAKLAAAAALAHIRTTERWLRRLIDDNTRRSS